MWIEADDHKWSRYSICARDVTFMQLVQLLCKCMYFSLKWQGHPSELDLLALAKLSLRNIIAREEHGCLLLYTKSRDAISG